MSKVKSRGGRPSHEGTEKDEREGEQMRIWVKAVKRESAAKERARGTGGNSSSGGGEVRRK